MEFDYEYFEIENKIRTLEKFLDKLYYLRTLALIQAKDRLVKELNNEIDRIESEIALLKKALE